MAAIRLDAIGKEYRLGHGWDWNATLRDRIAGAVAGAARLIPGRAGVHRNGRPPQDRLWALRDVSLEIGHGEVVGIIGRNGAGKSTLLKILSRITEPTTGRAEIIGRVASMLEVGIGFHPELTGRENVYLYGAILGMRKAETARKFDEIVAFADIDRFIDTPVKHYSSGMYMRLGFAVAAHLEPEILLVDEVLAVGDLRFQRKCLNKMHEVGQHGRTVVFVSHNLSAIARLCERAILIEGGRVTADGTPSEVISAYLSDGEKTSAEREWPDAARAPGGAVARLRAVRVLDGRGAIASAIDIRTPVTVEVEYDVRRAGSELLLRVELFNDEGIHALSSHDVDPAWRGRPRARGPWISRVTIPPNLLAEGTFYVACRLWTLSPTIPQFSERDAVAFQVIDSLDGDSARGDWGGPMGGVLRPLLPWTTRPLAA